MKYWLFQDTRPGKRPYNEDRLGCWQRDGALLLAVADGMGGHAHGEVAAQITVDHLGKAFDAEARPTLAEPERFLDAAVGKAHAQIHEQARQRRLVALPARRGARRSEMRQPFGGRDALAGDRIGDSFAAMTGDSGA